MIGNPFRLIWERLSGSLWLIPGLIGVAALALALAMVELSGLVDQRALSSFPRVFGADAASSRNALATIAGAIITVTGVTFSITVLVLSQAATQYTPRILRNFMRDRGSQVCLGVLVGVFLYCLVVIRTIRSDGPGFVPSLAVILAFVLAVVAIALLVYFIHHIASSLDVGSILTRISSETLAALDRDCPEGVADSDRRQDPLPAGGIGRKLSSSCFAGAPRTGFIQSIDAGRLLKFARTHELEIQLACAPGDFVVEKQPLAEVRGEIDETRLSRVMSRAVTVDCYRTVLDDPAFGIRQMTDIALKALSPAMNDVTTAMTCLHYLQVAMTRASRRRLRWQGQTGARVLLHRPSFEILVAEPLEEVRIAGAAHPRVLRRLVALIEAIGKQALPVQRQVLHGHLDLIAQNAPECCPMAGTQPALLRECRRVQESWQAGEAGEE